MNGMGVSCYLLLGDCNLIIGSRRVFGTSEAAFRITKVNAVQRLYQKLEALHCTRCKGTRDEAQTSITTW